MTNASTTVRSRGPYRTGLRRREQIIDAATAVFAEYGYAGGSVRTIADRIGVSPASLLQHFGSKEGLLMAVLEDWDRRTVEARLTDVTGLDYFRRLPEVMGAHLANRGLLELFSTIAAEASSPSHPAHEFIQQPLHRQPRHPRHTSASKPSRPATSPHSPRPRSTWKCVWSPPCWTGSGCNGCSTPPPTSPPASRPTSTEPSPAGALLPEPGSAASRLDPDVGGKCTSAARIGVFSWWSVGGVGVSRGRRRPGHGRRRGACRRTGRQP